MNAAPPPEEVIDGDAMPGLRRTFLIAVIGLNLTGVASLSVEIGSKRLELLHELMPTATTIGLLINPTNPNAEDQLREIQASARALGLRLHLFNATTEQDIDKAFATMSELQVGALIIAADVLFVDRSKELATFALRYGLPTISINRDFVVDGGLMSYGAGLVAPFRLMGVYTGRVLAGNLKTAKTLGISVPIPVLGRADEVIE